MNILTIPSWYPSSQHPNTGIFFREQTKLLAGQNPDHIFGISIWGSHNENLLIKKNDGFRNVEKIVFKSTEESVNQIKKNCIEYFTPAFTWTKKFLSGNINGIINANLNNASKFKSDHGVINLIHAHVCYPAGFVAMKISRQLKIPFIISEHMSPFPFVDFKINGGISELVHDPLQNSNQNIAVSNHLRQQFEQHGIKSLVIPNYIDEDFFTITKRKILSGSFRFCCVARLVKQKGFEVLLKGFEKICFEKDIVLTIIGAGNEEKEIMKMSLDLNLHNKIQFLGEQNSSVIKETISDSHAMVLASHHESFGIVLIEAIACGKPIIATACGGPEDIVNETNGLLAKVNDSDDLASKMVEMIDHYHQYDPVKIREDFMQRFSSKVITPKIIEVYTKAIEDYKAGRIHT